MSIIVRALEDIKKLDEKDRAFAIVYLAVAEGLNNLAEAIRDKNLAISRGELHVRVRSGG